MISPDASFFPKLPNDSKLWVFPLSRPIPAAIRGKFLEQLEERLSRWKSHGQPVTSSYSLEHDHFIIIAAHIPGADVSGCGIDALRRDMISLAEEFQTSLDLTGAIYLRGNDQTIQQLQRFDFSEALRAGKIPEDALVFDTALSSLAELRASGFEREVRNSWHCKL